MSELRAMASQDTSSTSVGGLGGISQNIQDYINQVQDIAELTNKICNQDTNNPAKLEEDYSQLQSTYNALKNTNAYDSLKSVMDQVDATLKDITICFPVPATSYTGDNTETKAIGGSSTYDQVTIPDPNDSSKTQSVYLVPMVDQDGNTVSALDLIQNWNNKDFSCKATWDAKEVINGDNSHHTDYGNNMNWDIKYDHNHFWQGGWACLSGNAHGDDSDALRNVSGADDSVTVTAHDTGHTHQHCYISSISAKTAAAFGYSEANSSFSNDMSTLKILINKAY